MSSTPSTSFEVLARIWGDTEGYVWVPWIEAGSWASPNGPRYHEGRAWRWPDQAEEISATILQHEDDDQYFTPGVFSAPRRVTQHAIPVTWLWADLDPVDPTGISGFTPTIAWETSPERYQCVWEMPYPREGATQHGGPNHKLTSYIGADPSGWDATQLLRIPGSAHTKHGNQRGELLWADGPKLHWRQLVKLPDVPNRDDDAAMQALSEDALRGVDRAAVWARVRPLVSTRTRELMALRDATVLDRSEALWSVERDLADAGCSVLEIVALVMGTPLDKYQGRGDHLRRLSIEASRAVAERPSESLEGGALPSGSPMWASDLASIHVPKPRWLINGIWTQGGCGFVSGAPKSYKSWLSLDMAVSIATGKHLLGEHRVVSPGPVLYLQEEDSLATVVDRLESIVEGRAPRSHWGGTLEVDKHGSVSWEPPEGLPVDIQAHTGVVLSDPRWMAWLSERVRTYEYRAVVVDTLTTTVGDVDLDKAVDLQTRVLRPLREIAQTYDCAVIIVHHSRKNTQSGRRGSNMLGSVALHGWVDCALYLERDEESGIITVSPEGKHDPAAGWSMRVPRVHRNWVSGERAVWAPEIVDEEPAAETAPRVAGGKLAEVIRGMGGTAGTADLRAVIGRGFSRQLASAVSNGLIEESSPGVYMLVRAKRA